MIDSKAVKMPLFRVILPVLAFISPTANGLITWPLKTTVGLQAEALNNLTGNRNVYATCNYVLFTEHVDYPTAAKRCQDVSLGKTTTVGSGTLATIDNEQKNNELSDLMKVAFGPSVGPEIDRKKYHDENWCWIGLHKIANLLNAPGSELTLAQMKSAAKKMKGKSTTSDWMWEDMSPANDDWMNWDNDQPDQYPDNDMNTQNHVRMYKKGLWDDSFDYKTSPFACDYTGKYILVETKMTVSNAEQACAAAGLTLAKVRSASDNEELAQAINLFIPQESEEEWDAANWVWIGVNDLAGQGYSHFDGEEVGFNIPWYRNQPDHAPNFGTVEHYVAVNRVGSWDDSFGQHHERPFACMCSDSE